MSARRSVPGTSNERDVADDRRVAACRPALPPRVPVLTGGSADAHRGRRLDGAAVLKRELHAHRRVSRQIPVPPSIFVIWDGMGLVVLLCSHGPGRFETGLPVSQMDRSVYFPS